MKNLNYYKKILQDKSKNLSFSDYLKYITSLQEISFYKYDGFVSKFPKSDRIKLITTIENFDKQVEYSMKDNNFYNYYLNLSKKSSSFNSKNVEGNFILNGENLKNNYFVSDTKNGKNLMFFGGDSENENNYNVFT